MTIPTPSRHRGMTGQIWMASEHSGFLPIGTISKVADTKFDFETDEPIVVLSKYERTITATITATGPAARDLAYALTGMPFFYIPPRPQLLPAPDSREPLVVTDIECGRGSGA